jgi:hypothetical protein
MKNITIGVDIPEVIKDQIQVIANDEGFKMETGCPDTSFRFIVTDYMHVAGQLMFDNLCKTPDNQSVSIEDYYGDIYDSVFELYLQEGFEQEVSDQKTLNYIKVCQDFCAYVLDNPAINETLKEEVVINNDHYDSQYLTLSNLQLLSDSSIIAKYNLNK